MQYDLTKPNTGRTIDYWLGGTHNFEIDRQFADRIAAQWPLTPKQCIDERRRIKLSVQSHFAHGIRAIVDFGSGLPTCGNTHIAAHELDPEIRVVYCDIDPVTTAYGQEILLGQPNVVFLNGDAANPLTILEAPETRALLGDNRLIGINFMFLLHMMTDEQLRDAWQTLYAWAAPGSRMTLTVPSQLWETNAYMNRIVQSYRRANIGSQYRSPAEIEKLLTPWKLTAEGIEEVNPTEIPDGDTIQIVNISYTMTVYKE